MRQIIYTFCFIGCVCTWGGYHVQAQEPDSVEVVVADTMEVFEDSLERVEFPDEEEGNEEFRDSTTIIWGNKSRIIITEDKEGNRVIKLVKKKEGEAEEWEDEDEGYYEEDEDHDDWEYSRRNGYSNVEFLAFDLGVTNYYNNENFGVDAAVPDLEVRSFRPGSHVALHFLPTTVSLFGRGVVNLKTAITIDWTSVLLYRRYTTAARSRHPHLDLSRN